MEISSAKCPPLRQEQPVSGSPHLPLLTELKSGFHPIPARNLI